jgi:hypothetical protein
MRSQTRETRAAHDDHDRGLAFDLRSLGRRRMMTLLAGGGLATTATASSSKASGAAPSEDADTDTAVGASGGDCEEIPEETAGPYPGDGSNGPDVLTESGIVRRDIRSSFGNAAGATAEGVP